MWVAVAVLAVGPYLVGLPTHYDQLLALSIPDLANPAALKTDLKEVGLSVGFYAAYGVTTEIIFAAVGFLIFWLKSDEPIDLLVALTMVMFVGGSAPYEPSPQRILSWN
jgi:hypothetical protein